MTLCKMPLRHARPSCYLQVTLILVKMDDLLIGILLDVTGEAVIGSLVDVTGGRERILTACMRWKPRDIYHVAKGR
jgi:hypothetical protein